MGSIRTRSESGTPRMTRGQCDSLFLHRLGLSPFTPCRSPGARLSDKAFELLGANSHRQVPDRKQPRPKNHVKPHPNLAYKG